MQIGWRTRCKLGKLVFAARSSFSYGGAADTGFVEWLESSLLVSRDVCRAADFGFSIASTN